MANRLMQAVRLIESQLAKDPMAPYGGMNPFGLWLNFCANSPVPEEGIYDVCCVPHVDAKNGALLVCAVFVYANGKCKALPSWSGSVLTCLHRSQERSPGEVLAGDMGGSHHR